MDIDLNLLTKKISDLEKKIKRKDNKSINDKKVFFIKRDLDIALTLKDSAI